MKAISLWQPWASLIAIGAKRIETRSWETMYRGPIAIHSAKKWTDQLFRIATSDPFYCVLAKVLRPNEAGAFYAKDWLAAALPLGAIVATANLLDTRLAVDVARQVSVQERHFGDYSAGRFAWMLSDIKRLETPIPCRGRQGLFDVEL